MQLSQWQFELMADQLRNDEYSTDDQMREFFMTYGKIEADIADQAIQLRPAFLCDPRVQLTLQDNQLSVTPVVMVGGTFHS